jgi:hypothetical protein
MMSQAFGPYVRMMPDSLQPGVATTLRELWIPHNCNSKIYFRTILPIAMFCAMPHRRYSPLL